jgi:pSer/pThr/pTyr-binding forkhead associated (FHA) protein
MAPTLSVDTNTGQAGLPGTQTVRDPQPYGRLVCVLRDGSDGKVFMLSSEHSDIGRTEGEITFAEDKFLAARHARVERRGTQVWVRPIDRLNGVYVKVTEPVSLADGDHLLLGKEVLRYETVDREERDAQPSMQHGTWVFASPPRSPWGRLRQIVVSGMTRDVVHLSKNEIILGREDGDVRYPDDEFMSRRHASLTHQGGRVQLQDLGSSNGTFLRLRAERQLAGGDVIRLGDQLFRFEMV